MKALSIIYGLALAAAQAQTQTAWKNPPLTEPNRVELGADWGNAYARGMARLGRDPFTTPFVLADVDFGMNRWFTNFSGDISGRFLEVTSLTSTGDHPQPAILTEVMDRIGRSQKADGHFGAEVKWADPIDFNTGTDQTKVMPILWGNGRLLLGLVAAYERFGQSQLLDSARKLADFYVNIAADRFCDPKRIDEYRKPSAYAGNYVTCVFEGMEGLVRIYRATRDPRYLQTVRRMADFHETFDALPVDHSHGSLSQHGALLMLYEETGDAKYLRRVVTRWDRAVKEGFINPSGGVLEKFWVTGYDRDEGCSEADWLRLNLLLWRNTGETRYLDMAERLLWSEYLANQWPSGGFGHRYIGCDETGPYSFQKHHQESLWCCSFHAPLALYHLKSYLAVAAGNQGIYYNFPVDFTAPVQVGQTEWTVASRQLPAASNALARCEVTLTGPASASVPLYLRIPDWSDRVVIIANGKMIHPENKGGYLWTPPVKSGTKLALAFHGRPYLENRRLQRLPIPLQLPASLDKVAVKNGPFLMVNANSGDIQTVALKVNAAGILQLPDTNSPVTLSPYYQLTNAGDPHAFLFNVKLEKTR
jgi:DUF1680 family protein